MSPRRKRKPRKNNKKRGLLTRPLFLLVCFLVLVGFATGWFFWFKGEYNLLKAQQLPSDFKKVRLLINGKGYDKHTGAESVEQFLKEESLKVSEDDILFPGEETPISEGLTIRLDKPTEVEIEVDGIKIKAKTFKENVVEVIEEKDIRLSHLDIVTPTKEKKLYNGMEIEVVRVEIEKITKEEEIPFGTLEKDDDTLGWRKQKLLQEGEEGIREVTYEVTYKNGKESEREKIDSEIIKEPKPKIVLNGTKIEVGETYKGRASWYAYTGKMACASLRHPKGTWLRVTNLENKKQVIVVVNDSGPYAPDKVIDLDKEAFKRIASLSQGVANVKVEEILN